MSAVTRSRPTSVLYDSRRDAKTRGVGYPSCNTELAVLPPNTADPCGYYRELGVSPAATQSEIRSRVRAIMRELHPDTGSGDVDRLRRVRHIAEVLLDPVSRDRYNRTPKGMRLMDAVYADELRSLGVLDQVSATDLGKVMSPRKASSPSDGLAARYDYFARDPLGDLWQGDALKAQLWYHFLVEAAPLVNYRRVIKVMMTNGQHAAYHHDINLMEIPRSWEPSSALAMSLFTHVAGFRPGFNDPQTRLSTIHPTDVGETV